jgi:sugar-phosphatase
MRVANAQGNQQLACNRRPETGPPGGYATATPDFARVLQVCETEFMPSFSCEGILFDLDGVLVDSTPCVSRIWTEWAIEHRLDPAHVVHVTHGQRTIDSVRELAPHLDPQAETDKIERLEIADNEGLSALPGAKELLTSLPPDRYTIVTSGTRPLATTRLRAVGLPVPPRMVTANEVSQGKPNPEPYLAGAALLGLAPETCLVFEDAPSGILAAKAAGMTVIGVLTTYAREDLVQADLIIPSLSFVSARLQTTGTPALLVEIAETKAASD